VVNRIVAALLVVGCGKPAAQRDDVRAPERGASSAADPAPVGAAAGTGEAAPARDAAAMVAIDARAAEVANVGRAADAAAVAIVDAPMAWSDERARLTLEYRRQHSDPAATDLDITPRVIVLHYTDGDSAKATRAYFDTVRIESARKDLAKAGAVNVSAHFLVDRDGTIYRLQPETRFARHCIGLNHVAIGIENVGGAKLPLTDAQVTADAALVRDLAHRFAITHLLGHFEVMGFRANPLYVERDPAYKNDKPDPGPRFMARVRALVEDLHLAGP
jgi:N-acetylmuramoyl-L-alanine amidase-like protein